MYVQIILLYIINVLLVILINYLVVILKLSHYFLNKL